MIRETEKRLLPGAACAVLFVHGILGSPAQFAPFLPLVPQDWSFCNLLLQGHGGGARDFSAASMAVWREQARQAFAELRAQHETVVIAAHSMGTLFAVQEAVRSPVEGLFLLNVPLHVHVRPRALRNAWHAEGPVGAGGGCGLWRGAGPQCAALCRLAAALF